MITRIIDFIAALFLLFILIPTLVIISIVIIINSNGSAFFVQQRVGRNNVDFSLFKFRTMHTNSESKGQITIGNRDPRITSFGYFLRKTKLDELPQLFNVIIGNMSFVGPRPEVRKYVDLYTPEQLKILSVRPGISDFASIKFSNENEILENQSDPEKYYIDVIVPEKIELNMKYIKNPSLTNYFKVILMTLRKVTEG